MDKLTPKRFRELLEHENIFTMKRQAFLRVSPQEFYELSLAHIIIEDKSFWRHRVQYFNLVTSYQLKQIDRDTFIKQWKILFSESINSHSRLVLLSLNPDSLAHITALEELFQNSVNFELKGFAILLGLISKAIQVYSKSKILSPATNFDEEFDIMIDKKINQLKQYIIQKDENEFI